VYGVWRGDTIIILGQRKGEQRREGSLEQKREKQREVGGNVDWRREQIREAQGLSDQQW
jgi:hypothetical protein